jgi:hypothetical protein
MELSDWRSQENDTGVAGRNGVSKENVGRPFTQASLTLHSSKTMSGKHFFSIAIEPCQCRSGWNWPTRSCTCSEAEPQEDRARSDDGSRTCID